MSNTIPNVRNCSNPTTKLIKLASGCGPADLRWPIDIIGFKQRTNHGAHGGRGEGRNTQRGEKLGRLSLFGFPLLSPYPRGSFLLPIMSNAMPPSTAADTQSRRLSASPRKTLPPLSGLGG